MQEVIAEIVQDVPKTKSKEEIDREYSQYALLIGDRYIKMRVNQKQIDELHEQAVKLIQEAEELAKLVKE